MAYYFIKHTEVYNGQASEYYSGPETFNQAINQIDQLKQTNDLNTNSFSIVKVQYIPDIKDQPFIIDHSYNYDLSKYIYYIKFVTERGEDILIGKYSEINILLYYIVEDLFESLPGTKYALIQSDVLASLHFKIEFIRKYYPNGFKFLVFQEIA